MRCFVALVYAVALVALPSSAAAVDYVVDDFDGGEDARVTGFFVTPDNSGNFNADFAPGVFPTSNADIFGRTNRLASSDFGDDSLTGVGNPEESAGDTLGIVPFAGPSGRNATDHFFGTNDVKNTDNPDGGGTAVWTIDIGGLSNLSLSAIFSAMSDFEAGDNSHTFTASIDGSAAQTLFAIDANNDAAFQYTMEGGALVSLDDPLEITDDFGTRVIDNTFSTTGTSLISGTGSVLTLTYTGGVNNGSLEPFAFDNLILRDDPLSLPDADFDGSGSVDATDLGIWKTNFGLPATATMGDADGDGDADGADFLRWQRELSSLSQIAAIAVPEPASLLLLTVALALLAATCRR